MRTTVEITASAIRLVGVRDGRVASLDAWPVPAGADPLAVLAQCPLPAGLGSVRVVMHHEDLLLRALVLPEAPRDRLDRVVRFEVIGGVDAGDDVAVAWAPVPVGTEGLRVLALLAKRRLIERLRQALVPSGTRLAALVHPAAGLAAALRVQEPDHQGIACLLDLGGRHLHIALVKDGEPILLRSAAAGMDELAARIAEARSLTRGEASQLLARIGPGSPEDLHDLIAAQAGAVAAQVTAALRFARAQLQSDGLDPAAVHLAGAGAQVHGLPAALAARLGLPVRLLNPFVGHLPALGPARLDRLSALPSPWTVALGAAVAVELPLDALADERAERRRRWLTVGVLRVAAAAAILTAAIAVALVETRLAQARGVLADLAARAPRATAAALVAEEARAGRDAARARLDWLDGERRLGRVVPELLAAAAALQDPQSCPVALTALRAARRPGLVRIELEGAALAQGSAGTDAVLRGFEQGLRRLYPAISSLTVVPVPFERDRHPFRFVLTVPDRDG